MRGCEEVRRRLTHDLGVIAEWRTRRGDVRRAHRQRAGVALSPEIASLHDRLAGLDRSCTWNARRSPSTARCQIAQMPRGAALPRCPFSPTVRIRCGRPQATGGVLVPLGNRRPPHERPSRGQGLPSTSAPCARRWRERSGAGRNARPRRRIRLRQVHHRPAGPAAPNRPRGGFSSKGVISSASTRKGARGRRSMRSSSGRRVAQSHDGRGDGGRAPCCMGCRARATRVQKSWHWDSRRSTRSVTHSSRRPAPAIIARDRSEPEARLCTSGLHAGRLGAGPGREPAAGLQRRLGLACAASRTTCWW